MIIVGICGASGSGKSTLARRIQDSLACSCTIIGQDCYYRNFPDPSVFRAASSSITTNRRFSISTSCWGDIDLLRRKGLPITTKGVRLRELPQGRHAGCADPAAGGARCSRGFTCSTTSASLSAWRSRCFCMWTSISAWLRRIKRDIKARGRSIDNIAEQYVETVKPVLREVYRQLYQRRGFRRHARRQKQDGDRRHLRVSNHKKCLRSGSRIKRKNRPGRMLPAKRLKQKRNACQNYPHIKEGS